jgi:hypothetical protein
MNWLDTLEGVSDIVSKHWPPPQKPKPLWTPGQPSIDIVIPHRGDKILTALGNQRLSTPMSGGLLLTLMTCENALKGTNLDYRYFIVANGVAASGPEREALNGALAYLDKTGRVGKVFDLEHGISPGSARALGVSAGKGDLIFFFDNHCAVREQFFTSAVKTFETTGADSVHVVTFNHY